MFLFGLVVLFIIIFISKENSFWLLQAVEDYVKYNLLLKLSRGIKEEKLEVKVYRTAAGKFLLNMMEHHDM